MHSSCIMMSSKMSHLLLGVTCRSGLCEPVYIGRFRRIHKAQLCTADPEHTGRVSRCWHNQPPCNKLATGLNPLATSQMVAMSLFSSISVIRHSAAHKSSHLAKKRCVRRIFAHFREIPTGRTFCIYNCRDEVTIQISPSYN